MSILRYSLGSTVGLIIILSLYTIFGSVVFSNLEDGVDILTSDSEDDIIDEEIEDLIRSLKSSKNLDDGIKWNDTMLSIQNYKNIIKKRLSPMSKKKMDIWKSLYFCFTIYTSIGYGNIVPDTSFGKFFTCIYAFIGIPLCLLTLDRVGKLVVTLLKWCNSNINRVRSDSIPLYLMITVMILYMFLGHVLYQGKEKWSTTDGLYFLFISFTTIGFGDISPDDSKYFMLTIAYQFIGLSMMASVINLVAAKLEEFAIEDEENKKQK